MTPLNRLGATEAAALIRDGRFSSRELVEACLERISLREGEINAWAACNREVALAQADACDRSPEPLGPLHGVPVGVKDVLDTADFPTAHGSPIYAGNRPKGDAACVAALRRAGAVIMGKTATAEFASITPPATRNPLNPDHTPGGSSSGSAAAVADFMVPLSLGTQTAGSLIRPAAFCGVVGYKPTYNLVNRAGLKFSAETLDTIGWMGRSVADIALMFKAIGRTGGAADRSPTNGLRLGLCMTDLWPAASSEAQEALMLAAERFRLAGLHVEDCDLPLAYSSMMEAHATIIRYEAARATLWEYSIHPELLSERFRSRLTEGMAISSCVHAAALRQVDDARRECDAFFSRFDAVITLSAKGPAPQGLATTGEATFNGVWTMLGVPCLHLPFCNGRNGLPLGIQLVGARYVDPHLLSVARELESVLGSS